MVKKINKTIISNFFIFLKGTAMGAADIIPGVSGGTIAFITGIYEELIDSINSFDLKLIKIFQLYGIKGVWKEINGNFLFFLFTGILISIFSLANIIVFLIDNHTIKIWSFFFGLVSASIWIVGKNIKKWNNKLFFIFMLSSIFAFFITQLSPITNVEKSWFIFFSGFIGICAMVLPGISGSFILLILGSYETIIEAIKFRDFSILLIFGLGAILGILSFAKFLKLLFKKYYDIIITIMTGFLLGSIHKLWPWKINYGDPIYINSEGRIDYLQRNISPFSYDGDPQLIFSLLFFLIAVLFVYFFEIKKIDR